MTYGKEKIKEREDQEVINWHVQHDFTNWFLIEVVPWWFMSSIAPQNARMLWSKLFKNREKITDWFKEYDDEIFEVKK